MRRRYYAFTLVERDRVITVIHIKCLFNLTITIIFATGYISVSCV